PVSSDGIRNGVVHKNKNCFFDGLIHFQPMVGTANVRNLVKGEAAQFDSFWRTSDTPLGCLFGFWKRNVDCSLNPLNLRDKKTGAKFLPPRAGWGDGVVVKSNLLQLFEFLICVPNLNSNGLLRPIFKPEGIYSPRSQRDGNQHSIGRSR